jgi:hypothetical protein
MIDAATNLATTTPTGAVSERSTILPALPTEDREAQFLWNLRYHVACTRVRQLLGTARLRTLLVVGLSLFFWIGLFILFYEGFQFIVDNVDQPRGQ